MIKRYLALSFILLVMVMSLIHPSISYGIADPDTPPQVSSVYVFSDLLEDGDLGIFVDYYLDYAVLPDESATEAYLVSFIDTDGATQLSSTSPYAYNDDGYGRGAAWLYFDADEVTALSIDAVDEALYEVWLHGNPTVSSGWVGDPPKTVANIDEWYETGEAIPSVILRYRVLAQAAETSDAWSLDLIEETVEGTRFTTYGEQYYTNVIPNLRLMAPACFASGSQQAVYEDLDYDTIFGAELTNGTGIAVGAPIDYAEGTTTTTINTAGTFTIMLEHGTVGTVTNGTGLLGGDVKEDLLGGGEIPTGTYTLGSAGSGPVFLGHGESPLELVAGINIIEVVLAGTIDVYVHLVNTQTTIWDGITGTTFDLSDVADLFGLSNTAFSGFIWMIITVLICYATFTTARRSGTAVAYGSGSSKSVMVVFDICIVGGALLGMLPLLFAALMFIAFGFLTGYVLFYRGASF